LELLLLHNTILKFTLRFNARRYQSIGRTNKNSTFLEEEENRNFRCAFKLKDNVINVAGKMKLQQELQLISNLDVMVSMDSGNALLQQCLE
jgi:hypothetical protein